MLAGGLTESQGSPCHDLVGPIGLQGLDGRSVIVRE